MRTGVLPFLDCLEQCDGSADPYYLVTDPDFAPDPAFSPGTFLLSYFACYFLNVYSHLF
jgi:hypothetical protein